MPPLELTQVREERRDFARRVLVDAVESHKRIEDEELGSQRRDGLGEAVAIALDIESHRRCGDDVDVEVGEIAARRRGDAGEALAHDVERIFGGEEQYAAGLRHTKAPQTRHATGDGDRDV